MRTKLPTVELDHLFSQHKTIINNIAWSFHKTTKMNYQEIQAECLLCFCRSAALWNPKNNPNFNAWMIHVLTNHINRIYHKHTRTKYLFSNYTEEPPHPDSNPYDALYFKEKLQNLSQDAQIACVIALNPEEYGFDNAVKGSDSAPKIRKALKDILKQRHWSSRRTWKAFQEIRKMLKEG